MSLDSFILPRDNRKRPKNSLADEIDERFRLNYAVVVELYQLYTQFLRNVRLSHRRKGTFLVHRDGRGGKFFKRLTSR